MVDHPELKMTEKSESVERRIIQISEDLYLMGVGGSVPALFVGLNVNEQNPYGSYPYRKGDLSYAPILEDLAAGMKKIQAENEKAKFIFMTHVGPMTSSTTVDLEYGKMSDLVVYGGSPSLDRILRLHSDSIILNLHGHSHCSDKKAMVGTVPVRNCNPAFDKNYAIYKFTKEEAGWAFTGESQVQVKSDK